MKKSKSLVTLVILGTWAGLANAQYVVVLKNGRQLTVQSYREEGSTVKIQGLGGELGIPKEQIQSISKSGQSDRPGLNVTNLDNASRSAPVAAKPTPSAPASGPSEVSGSTDANAGVNADEEKEYRQRLAEVTQKLESARKRYLEATRRATPVRSLTKKVLAPWTIDLASRIHDRQKVPGGGPCRYTIRPEPLRAPYTPRQKNLATCASKSIGWKKSVMI